MKLLGALDVISTRDGFLLVFLGLFSIASDSHDSMIDSSML